MKRSGFTMIELIFVIVILGILAAVALPKFIGVSEQAQLGKFKAYAGTLGRTTLSPYWGAHLTDGTAGVLTNTDLSGALADLPMIGEVAVADISFTAGSLEAPGFAFTAAPTNGLATLRVGTADTYILACSQGSMTQAPECNVWDSTNTNWLIN